MSNVLIEFYYIKYSLLMQIRDVGKRRKHSKILGLITEIMNFSSHPFLCNNDSIYNTKIL